MSNISLPRVRRIALIALGVAITALTVAMFYANRDAAQATHSPSNKVWVSASKMEVMHSQANPTSTDVITERPDEVILANGRGRFNNPTDLRLSVTSECALWTNTATFGDDDAESKARVEVWITIDGKVVPVSLDDVDGEGAPAPNPDPPILGGSVDPNDQAPQQGRVVFCNRATRMKTENIETTTVGPNAPGGTGPDAPAAGQPPAEDEDDEDDIVIRSYNRSRSANGFNWAAMNIGSVYDSNYQCADCTKPNGKGIVDIEVHARLATSLKDADNTDSVANEPMAMAAVGKRTLFVEPVKMANDASF